MVTSDIDTRPDGAHALLRDDDRGAALGVTDAVLDALPAGVAVLDDLGFIVAVNAAWRRFGAANGLRSPDCCVGMDYLAVCEQAPGRDISAYPPSSTSGRRVAEELREVLAGAADFFQFEYPCHSATQQRWFELRATPLTGSARPRGAVLMHVDITERKLMSQRMARLALETERRERMFSKMLASISDLTYVLDRDARVLHASQATLDLWGLSFDEASGKTAADIGYPAELAQRLLEQVRSVFDTGRPVKCETPFVDRHGRTGCYEYIFSPAFAPDGSVEFLVGCSRDVTEQRRTEEALKASAAEFRTLAAAMPQIVWASTGQGQLNYLNGQWSDYTGRAVADSLGTQWLESVHPEDVPQTSATLHKARETGQGCSQETRLRRADGQYRWWLIRCVCVRDEDGHVVKWIGTCTDIDELKAAERTVSSANQRLLRQRGELRELNANLEERVRERTAELALARDAAERANEAKSAFLATMSHEIRTPMSGLLGLLELLELSELDDEQLSMLAVARHSGRALQQIINGILDFAKIEANCLELDAAPGSLREVVESVCRLHQPVASGKKLALTWDVPANIRPSLQFDALRLGQILNNLVGNAIKFTERGFVEVVVQLVRSTPEKEHVRVTVVDSGIGIPPERIEQLFQPFVQASANTSTRFGGTGLGLFIARSLTALMKGALTMDSMPGEGTSVVLDLAFDACPERPSAQPPTGAARSRLDALLAKRPAALDETDPRRPLLLIVDDHPTNRIVLLRQAAALGYRAEAASDGAQALQAHASGRFAGVITDCNMPDMSGYELAASIRAREAARGGPAVPIIGCTANALGSAAQACLNAGMDDCITKPVALEELCSKLDRWVPLVPAEDGPATTSVAQPVARAEAAPSDGLLNLALLDQIAGGDPQAFSQVIADLRRNNESDSRQLRAAVADADFTQAIQFAHRMRGACAMLGARQLAEASSQVHTAAQAQDLPALQEAMVIHERELLRLHEHLASLA